MRGDVGGDQHHLVHHRTQEEMIVRHLVGQAATGSRFQALANLVLGAA
nr:hypothetical protein [Luteibacter pinisoli]